MRLVKRLLILTIAAVLGITIYGRLQAVDNVANSAVAEKGKSHYSSYSNFKGGIGPVGNPYAPKPPRKRNY